MKRIAIIGGGFSGLAVLLHLIERTAQPLHVVLIEKSAQLGTGVAYGMASPWHPLNVSADQMGAMAGHSDDFYRWLMVHSEAWRSTSPYFKKLLVTPSSYLPRCLYGLYLTDLLKRGLAKSKSKHVTVDIIQDTVVDLDESSTGDWAVVLKGGEPIHADYVVLAMGVPPVKSLSVGLPALQTDQRYVANLWQSPTDSLFGRASNSRIAILGSGLTAVDALQTLVAQGYVGEVSVLSKNGEFPCAHLPTPLPALKDYRVTCFPSSCLELMAQVSHDLMEVQAAGYDWRVFIDALRPFTPKLWQHLDLRGKSQFIRHVLPLWNRHRHRMSPESALQIDSLIKKGKLTLSPAVLVDMVDAGEGKLKLQYVSGKVRGIAEMTVDRVINCLGPEYSLEKRNDPFIHDLVRRGTIQPDDLGLGLKTVHGETLAGNNRGTIFALGSLLFGDRFETTSVPEIRHQAASITNVILQGV